MNAIFCVNEFTFYSRPIGPLHFAFHRHLPPISSTHKMKESAHRSPLPGGTGESKLHRRLLHHPGPPLADGSLLRHETVTFRSHNRDEDRGDYDIHHDIVLVGACRDRVRHEARPRHGLVRKHLQRKPVLLLVGRAGDRRRADA